jgi:hypothetical protein
MPSHPHPVSRGTGYAGAQAFLARRLFAGPFLVLELVALIALPRLFLAPIFGAFVAVLRALVAMGSPVHHGRSRTAACCRPCRRPTKLV